jgi:oligoribonuclease NrnB/cAMP/cGMP phosphodiesterase (DHH superfamily)
MNIKLFTHTDLDGIGCAILALLTFEKVDIEYCNYGDVDNKIKAFVENEDYKNYDYVYITDISISEDLAEFINNTHPSSFKEGFNLPEMFQLIDHHPTALSLNKYYWCCVQIEDDKEKVSGTSMFFKELLSKEYLKDTPMWANDECESLQDFVEVIKRYDTWLWKTKYNDPESKQLNDLFYIYGREEFINKFVFRLKSNQEYLFSNTDMELLQLEARKIKEYIEKKEKEIMIYSIEVNDKSYSTGIVFAEQYISELGNTLAEKLGELDFITIIGSKTISYRGIKDDIDLGLIAKYFGGGGHPKAAGSEIDSSKKLEYINSLFK